MPFSCVRHFFSPSFSLCLVVLCYLRKPGVTLPFVLNLSPKLLSRPFTFLFFLVYSLIVCDFFLFPLCDPFHYFLVWFFFQGFSLYLISLFSSFVIYSHSI